MKLNRRKLLSLIGVSPAVLAGESAMGADSKPKRNAAAPMAAKLEVLNPKGQPPTIPLIPMAPRIPSLDGKLIYLVSDGFAGADRFLAQIALWFQKNMPAVQTTYRLKEGGLAGDDPKLWAEIKAKGSAMIMAYGH